MGKLKLKIDKRFAVLNIVGSCALNAREETEHTLRTRRNRTHFTHEKKPNTLYAREETEHTFIFQR